MSLPAAHAPRREAQQFFCDQVVMCRIAVCSFAWLIEAAACWIF
jgi:hypothetical protein